MRTSKLFGILGFSTMACIGTVAILYAMADKPNENKNGFYRKNLAQHAVLERQVPLKYPAYYIAGITAGQVYLANYSTSLHLLTVNILSGNTTERKLKVPSTEKYVWKSARISIDSPNIYLKDGITPKMFSGRLPELSMSRYMVHSAYFTNAVNISPESYIIRSVTGNNTNILFKMRADSPYLKAFPEILVSQIDGLFCTDGIMSYDKERQDFVYTYRFRNSFISLDTNLQVRGNYKLIDTNSVAKIQVASIKNSEKRIFSAPELVVNRSASVYRGNLFVASNLRADNQNRREISGLDIVDVYTLSNGGYRFSFYIPKEGEKELEELFIAHDRIFTISDKNLYIYKLPIQFN